MKEPVINPDIIVKPMVLLNWINSLNPSEKI